ncbi:hypothetical protein Syun_008605 [Stephania yunnanensis]|uniref:Uncharacterized protein n=1 Tax=Stephania yunnanensis TaxID=152371 RepID=A0AAP0PRI1_9MAGN
MKGKERGDRVADEESSGRNTIEALRQSTISFVPVHRSDARADDKVDWCAIVRCVKGKERDGEVEEKGSYDANEIEALHESAMPFAPVHRSDAQADGVGVPAAIDAEEGDMRRSIGGRRRRWWRK